ncbi:hypothetical protein RhiXN_01089 [Rhizoctonia solani]|uniref:Uncharacterized protein n=1 Tax=Rhizoctonia solani TaxID=456999 RepID=A0A8H8NVN1_9AGAM|nr:uncharacterized protein RhiXN_01089 [Rhizoctonia solani]QRW19683.1 hypothetical protein RhiXN_01089 [Rhizoctonia solani]
MLSALRIPRSSLGLDMEETRTAQAPVSPTDITSPVPSLSRSILSASDTSPNGWVTLELPRVSSPAAHSPSASSGKSESDGCPAHVRFQNTCLIIPDNPMKSPGLAARMLAVGSWTTSKRRVSDPDREHSPSAPLLGVRIPGLGRKHKQAPYSQHSTEPASSFASSEPVVAPRPRLTTAHSFHMMSPPPCRPYSFGPLPDRTVCLLPPHVPPACSKLDGVVHWSPGARRKRREDREERERETRAGLRDPGSNTAYGWEDMLAFESDTEDKGCHTGPSKSTGRRTTSPPPSSLATRRCGAIAAQALKHPLALPCPVPRACTEDDTDEESLFPLPVSPRGARSPTCRGSKSQGKLSPNNSNSSATPSPNASDELTTKCAETANPAKCAEVIATKCAEKAKTEVVVPAMRRLLEQQAFEGHRLSPVPGSEAPTPRSGTPTAPSFPNCDPEPAVPPKEDRGRSQITKLEMAQVDELPPQSQQFTRPPTSVSPDTRPSAGRRRSSSVSSMGRTIGAIVRGVAAGVVSGPPM